MNAVVQCGVFRGVGVVMSISFVVSSAFVLNGGKQSEDYLLEVFGLYTNLYF